MRNLARVILVVVAVFVVTVAAVLVVKSRTARVESLDPSPTKADLQIKEVDLGRKPRACGGDSRPSRR
jgi:hypothetical protein